jgi:hypothetical protein
MVVAHRQSGRHLIITAANEACGDFLINHWLASLKKNVNLAGIDIAVLDYGIGKGQQAQLERQGLTCIPCDGNGSHIVWTRWRDIAEFLRQKDYNQVMAVDGGDLIFQSDIGHLFLEHQEQWRAACEEIDGSFHDLIMKRDDFGKKEWDTISCYLKGKPTINNGLVLGPAKKFQDLWPFFQKWALGMTQHGGDQLLCNYHFYMNSFVRLDKKFNWVIITARRSEFLINNGIFYDKWGDVIPVVHNAGAKEGLIENFGFGKGHNQLNRFRQIRCHMGLAILRFYKKIGSILFSFHFDSISSKI